MAVIRCAMGHYFDNGKFAACPHCAKGPENLGRIGGMGEQATAALGRREVEAYAAWYVQRQAEKQRVSLDPERTVGMYESRAERDYICGWVVCTKGPQRGRDYRICHGFNRIGRELTNDIVLEGDLQVTREAHCSLVYEEQKNVFYLAPKGGSPTYLNGELLKGAARLNTGDTITVGDSVLEFVAFCEGEKKWAKEDTKEN